VGVLVGTPLAKGYEKGELTPFGQAPKLNPYKLVFFAACVALPFFCFRQALFSPFPKGYDNAVLVRLIAHLKNNGT